MLGQEVPSCYFRHFHLPYLPHLSHYYDKSCQFGQWEYYELEEQRFMSNPTHCLVHLVLSVCVSEASSISGSVLFSEEEPEGEHRIIPDRPDSGERFVFLFVHQG